MNKLFRQIGLTFILLVAISLGSCTSKYSYETVPNDPLKARIYTLDNGLKVYMTVNKETPRIQTYIAVRVGGKNDPAETTGLAHYFEHLMFKGTTNFGTQNYEIEKPLLDQIEEQFEVYRKTTDSLERKAIYAKLTASPTRLPNMPSPTNMTNSWLPSVPTEQMPTPVSTLLATRKISPAIRLTTGQNSGRTF